MANKTKFAREESLDLAKQSSRIWVAKGKKLIKFEGDETANVDEIAEHILGRSGTLRAPAIRVGDTFMVGFHAEAFEELFN